jgi:lysozyme
MPHINNAGLELIKSFEGTVLHVYPDPGTGGRPYTAGIGHTGTDVDALGLGAQITQAQADEWLSLDLIRFEKGVNALCEEPLSSNQFSALVCFAYNVGLEALRGSTIMRLINEKHADQAASHFGSWVYADEHVMPGLVRRRAAEAALFSKGSKNA